MVAGEDWGQGRVDSWQLLEGREQSKLSFGREYAVNYCATSPRKKFCNQSYKQGKYSPNTIVSWISIHGHLIAPYVGVGTCPGHHGIYSNSDFCCGG